MKKQVLLTILLLLPLVAMADDSGKCGENLTWTYTESNHTLTISGTGEMTNFGYQNHAPWVSYRNNIIKVNIGEGVTSIGDYSFKNCSILPTISIPDGVTSIGGSAFYGCSSLTSITIPDGVTSIGGGAFHHCYSLTSILIPDGVTIIGENAFASCYNIKTIILPKNLSIIKKMAFFDCSNLESITIPASVEYIYQEAFANSSNLKEVTALPEEPPFLYANSFSNYDITLKVPESATNKYKSTEPWSNFKEIIALNGDQPETKKCSAPTISYNDGKIVFSCETEDVEYIYNVTIDGNKTGIGSEVKLTGVYKVCVYATKEGYENSETVTKEIEINGQNGSQDVNGDGIVDTQDVLEIYKYIQEH